MKTHLKTCKQTMVLFWKQILQVNKLVTLQASPQPVKK